MRRKTSIIITAAFVTWLVVACGGGGSGSTAPPAPTPRTTYNYAIPPDIGDGWATAALSDEGFDTQRILDMMDLVVNGDFEGIDSVVIARNNKLLLYWYDTSRALDEFDDWIGNRDPERHVLHSTSKSFTSALAGIAVDMGLIASVQVGFYDLFSYASYANWDPRKADMTLEDVLTMRLGLEWDEWSLPYTDPGNDLATLTRTHSDWAKALLDLPMTTDPGTSFTYNTAATNALSQALQNAAGMPLAEFANLYLFYPMQITDAAWATTPTGLPVGGSGLFLRSRDLAKFGQLYIDDGTWQGQQLISPGWIAATVVRHADVSSWATFSEAYGYQWWLGDFYLSGQPVETWVTSGYGGQYLFAVPSLDLVVAFTGRNYQSSIGIENLFTMMRSYILPSID